MPPSHSNVSFTGQPVGGVRQAPTFRGPKGLTPSRDDLIAAVYSRLNEILRPILVFGHGWYASRLIEIRPRPITDRWTRRTADRSIPPPNLARIFRPTHPPRTPGSEPHSPHQAPVPRCLVFFVRGSGRVALADCACRHSHARLHLAEQNQPRGLHQLVKGHAERLADRAHDAVSEL